MKKTLFIFICLLAGIPRSAFAQTNDNIANGSAYAKEIASYVERTVPGIRGAQTITKYHITLVWKSKDAPTVIFWRGDNGWWVCQTLKGHKSNTRSHAASAYRTKSVNLTDIKKGDTVEVVAMAGGKYPIPTEIPKSAKNTLFFRTANSGWLSFPVKKLTKAPDVIMP